VVNERGEENRSKDPIAGVRGKLTQAGSRNMHGSPPAARNRKERKGALRHRGEREGTAELETVQGQQPLREGPYWLGLGNLTVGERISGSGGTA